MPQNNCTIKFLSKYILFLITLSYSALSFSQSATITTTNGSTREVKNYSVGNQDFEIPVSSTAGWNKCSVTALKEFEYEGQKRMRVDMYCSTQQGQMSHFYCTTGKGNMEVTIAQIMATGSRYNSRTRELNLTGNLEMVITCNYLRLPS